MAALPLALAQESGFTGYEVDPGGNPTSHAKERELDLVYQMLYQSETLSGEAPAISPNTSLADPRHFKIKAGVHNNRVELWERSCSEAEHAFEHHKFDGVVISIPIQTESGGSAEDKLNALIKPLRLKYWSESGKGNPPWIILDLTQYEMLFCQIVPEMLTPSGSDQLTTPYMFAARHEIRRLAARSFFQRWSGNNELTRLVNEERRRCVSGRKAQPQAFPRVMVQVSSAWGFLVGGSGSGARHPANCRHPAETASALPIPRFPRFSEMQKRTLAELRFGASRQDTRRSLEEIIGRFLQVWKPIGIVDPLPTVVWCRPAPNMHWAPELLSGSPAR